MYKKPIYLSNNLLGVEDEPDYGETSIEQRTDYTHQPENMT